ncbi:MAG: Chromate transporter [Clostridiales bacterium]|jgi:chromate transporter|nr:Chromate transporter [Clostridiales bacterium]
MNKDKIKLLFEIFITFFKLGSVSFGGGYSMIPLIEREAVEEKKWMDKEKIIDIFAVAESLPGAIALNSSAFVGYSVAGIPGALAALLGNMTPSVVIVLTLTSLFSKVSTYPVVKEAFRGIYPAIVGLISFAAYKIGKTAIKDVICIIIAIIAFSLIMFLNFDPVIVIIFGAAAGLVLTFIKHVINLRSVPKSADDGGSRK